MFYIVTYDTVRMYSSNLFIIIVVWTFLLNSRKKKAVDLLKKQTNSKSTGIWCLKMCAILLVQFLGLNVSKYRPYCPVTSMTSSSELLPPFSALWCLSGWVSAAPSRLEVGLLKWERKPDEEVLGIEEGRVPDPERRCPGSILESGSNDWL